VHESTRERIVKVAGELFSEKPHGEVSIEEIARHANVSKGAIFHYFKSKYHLAVEVMMSFSREWAEHLKKLSQKAISAQEKLKMVLDETFEMVRKNPRSFVSFSNS